AQAMKADGDQRPIDHIRLDLCRDLLRGVPLPEATCQLITAPLAAEDTGHLDDADPTGGIAPPREADQPIDIRQTADQHTDRHADPSVDLALAAQMSDTGSTEPAPHLLDQASDTGSTEPAPHLLDQPAAARASHEAPHHIGQGPGPGRTARPGRARPAAGVRGSGLDSITAQAERQIAYALAHAADERLTGVFERARREGRLDGMARLIGEAVEAMRDALDPLVDSWCRATSPAPRPANGPHDTLDTGARARGAHGRDGYRPPATLQRLIQRRHATCVYPSCHRRSRRCDLDHTKPYDRGGRTCRCNLAPLCRAHHRLFKQHWQWKLIQLWPGLLIWIAPAGTWHIVLPE
ncbi:MAG TPA: HNH endonuclease signature motif containing protein, partial [Streptosporangiaceae bacterium]